jgi:hypothetical protein
MSDPIHLLLYLYIQQTSFYLPATCGEHFLASSCCSLYDYKALWRPHLTLTTQSTTMVTILAAHMFLFDYCRLNKYTEKATHSIPSTHSTIEKGKKKISVVVPLSLTCPSIPCFTLTLEQGSNTLFQSLL